MKNPSGKKLEKLVFKMFDQMIEGADKYTTKQGSTWLIFTEDKRWVVEFTKDKTLWFNYNLFQSELVLIGKDCTEEKDFIKNWFESIFLNKPKVKHTNHLTIGDSWEVEDTIQNGVKSVLNPIRPMEFFVKDIVETGVKHVLNPIKSKDSLVIKVIQNGVKCSPEPNQNLIEEVIENDVQDIKHSYDFEEIVVDDIISDSI